MLADYPRQPLDVYVVWMPMVGGDSFDAASRASAIFRDPRVHQFYDENRLCGLAYAEQVFPHAYDDADRSLPPDHWLRQHLAGIRELPREQRAFWDVVFFYAPPHSHMGGQRGVAEYPTIFEGEDWTDRPPIPTHWLKQTAYFGPRTLFRRGPTALFWQDSFTNPPFESDWFDALSDVMASMPAPLPRVP